MNPLVLEKLLPQWQAQLRSRMSVHRARMEELRDARAKELSRSFPRRRHEVLLMLDRETVKCEAALRELEAMLNLYEQNN